MRCNLCLRGCEVNRKENEKGFCRAGAKPAVYSSSPHHGEEPPLSGTGGSGTVFFTHCNMKCVYCQNYRFSRCEDTSRERGVAGLVDRMLQLEKLGCHNINFVSPTHYASQMKEAIKIARKKGLTLPIVYNTGGYDSPELIKSLDGIVDIYLPDMRYSDSSTAKKFSSAPDYAENNRIIVKEMFRQAGSLKTDENGIAQKGVIVRLLILPNNVSGTVRTLEFLKEEVSNKIYLSVMSQYYPTYRAREFPKIARRINREEYKEVTEAVEKLGFKNGWVQGFMSVEDKHFLGTNIKPT